MVIRWRQVYGKSLLKARTHLLMILLNICRGLLDFYKHLALIMFSFPEHCKEIIIISYKDYSNSQNLQENALVF